MEPSLSHFMVELYIVVAPIPGACNQHPFQCTMAAFAFRSVFSTAPSNVFHFQTSAFASSLASPIPILLFLSLTPLFFSYLLFSFSPPTPSPFSASLNAPSSSTLIDHSPFLPSFSHSHLLFFTTPIVFTLQPSSLLPVSSCQPLLTDAAPHLSPAILYSVSQTKLRTLLVYLSSPSSRFRS